MSVSVQALMLQFKTSPPFLEPGSKRTEKVIISPEGRILKKLREKHGLSMRAVGEKLGLSDFMQISKSEGCYGRRTEKRIETKTD